MKKQEFINHLKTLFGQCSVDFDNFHRYLVIVIKEKNQLEEKVEEYREASIYSAQGLIGRSLFPF
jgi:hypothetical protein